MENLRKKIIEIENSIISITGVNVDDFIFWDKKSDKVHKVRELLEERRHTLNDLFIPTAENIERFKKVNNHLIELSENLIRREGGINATLYYLEDGPSFDDNIIIETNMFIGKDNNVLRLSDDSTYGSDFQKIIEKLIASLNMDDNQIITYNSMNGIFSRKGKIHDAPWNKWEEFDGIKICDAVYDLCYDKSFSIPDLLRLNSFLCEARITFQNITSQDGTRHALINHI